MFDVVRDEPGAARAAGHGAHRQGREARAVPHELSGHTHKRDGYPAGRARCGLERRPGVGARRVMYWTRAQVLCCVAVVVDALHCACYIVRRYNILF